MDLGASLLKVSILRCDSKSAYQLFLDFTCLTKNLTLCFKLYKAINRSNLRQFPQDELAPFTMCTTDKLSQKITTLLLGSLSAHSWIATVSAHNSKFIFNTGIIIFNEMFFPFLEAPFIIKNCPQAQFGVLCGIRKEVNVFCIVRLFAKIHKRP